MRRHTAIIKWATDCLLSKAYALEKSPKMIVETPWSNVICFSTLKEDVFLKQTPPPLFIEVKIIQLLTDELQANTLSVIASNDELHCFLMKDAGKTLREYLKTQFQLDLLCQAIKYYTNMQQSTENHIESFFALGVPDWRLEKLPILYDQLINQVELLKADGLTDEELQILHDLSPNFSEQCKALFELKIPETLVQPDFNTNNILFDPNTKKITFIDLGEIVISHPFFSLHNFLYQATIHHGIKEPNQIFQLQNTYCEGWLALATKKQLLNVFMLVKKIYPIYSALAIHRLMMSVDHQAFKSYYANRPNRLAEQFREYIASSRN